MRESKVEVLYSCPKCSGAVEKELGGLEGESPAFKCASCPWEGQDPFKKYRETITTETGHESRITTFPPLGFHEDV